MLSLLYRFNHPAEAARLRAAVASQTPSRGSAGGVGKGQLGRVREAANCFLSKSMTDLARINETLFYGNDAEATAASSSTGDAPQVSSSSPPSPTPSPHTDANANEVLEEEQEEASEAASKRAVWENLRAELESMESDKDLERRRMMLDQLSEQVASARRKMQGRRCKNLCAVFIV